MNNIFINHIPDSRIREESTQALETWFKFYIIIYNGDEYNCG